MASEHVKGDQNLETKHEESKPLVSANSKEASIHSVSSSSSSSSEELEKSSLYDSPAKSEFEANKSSSPKSVSSPETTPKWSMTSTSPPPQEQMKSPPVQTMGQQQHPPGYDPNRIPASIFSTKSSNPAEWSTASNESLFSIHMGNNSFTSGEPFWLEDWNNSQLNQQNGSETKPNQVSSLPPVMEVPAHEESSVKKPAKGQKLEKEDSDRSLKDEKMISHSPPEIVTVASTDVVKPAETKFNSSSKHRLSSSNPRLSDESGNSSSSFAFPVLVNDGGKPGSFRAVAEKPEKPQLQPQASTAATPEASEIRWFSCLCCWPRCC